MLGEDIVRSLLKREGVGVPMGLDAELEIPETVELALRGDCLFLLNYLQGEVKIPCKGSFEALLGEGEADGAITLPPYGVAVLRRRA